MASLRFPNIVSQLPRKKEIWGKLLNTPTPKAHSQLVSSSKSPLPSSILSPKSPTVIAINSLHGHSGTNGLECQVGDFEIYIYGGRALRITQFCALVSTSQENNLFLAASSSTPLPLRSVLCCPCHHSPTHTAFLCWHCCARLCFEVGHGEKCLYRFPIVSALQHMQGFKNWKL